jgi:hypothetical protein
MQLSLLSASICLRMPICSPGTQRTPRPGIPTGPRIRSATWLLHRTGLPRHQGAERTAPPLPDRRRRLLDGVPHRPGPAPVGADPAMNAVIRIASIVAGEDFAAERARTMDNMGLSGLTREQLAAF